MRLLLDTCLSPEIVNQVVQAGHDVVWIGERLPDPGDAAILNEAHAQQRVLVTLDKDFGELAIVFGAEHHGIIRLDGIRLRDQATTIERVLAAHGVDLERGALITVNYGRMRIRESSS